MSETTTATVLETKTAAEVASFLALAMPEPNTGCWLWLGTRTSSGGPYGMVSARGRWVVAHRWSYQMFVGEIPDELEIDHVLARGCGNTICVNPDHLEAVTAKENSRRSNSPTGINAKKTECTKGHPLTGENLKLKFRKRWGGKTERVCRICRLASLKAGYRARTARATEVSR